MAKKSTPPVPPQIKSARVRGRWVGLAAGVVLLAGGVLGSDWWVTLPDNAQATYVGRQRCIDCHQEQNRQWTGSHHDQAMDHATPESVLGDFNNAELTHHGITNRMFRRGEKYFVNTEGPDGKMADFEVKFTFGVSPLQQYMVEFDRPADMPAHEIARLQVLRVCWNTVKKEWFYLPPPDVSEKIEPGDDLHWTGVAQRWNNMCADCHSTNLRKGFDLVNKQYHTTFSEIDVSCEACHGPGSLHVQLAESSGVFKWDRKRGYALNELKGKDNLAEIETCAACHSRRRVLQEGFPGGKKFHDYFAAEVLAESSYHADGQILDEVYEYGSFCQSKMFHKGIKCTDCHNPHNLQLKHEGNKLCTSCHAHPASRFDTFNHHRHKEGSTGAQCVNCHMPTTTYMEVDPRRDHSLRVPRPDLSVKLQTPNACTGCHVDTTKLPESVDRSQLKEYAHWLRAAREGDKVVQAELTRLDQWSQHHVNRWYSAAKRDVPHFATALAAGREHASDAERRLRDLLKDRRQPAIARATAAMDLGAYVQPETSSVEVLAEALRDPSPQVRAAAIMSLMNASEKEITAHLSPLLQDPVKFVRLEAARSLAHISASMLHPLDVPRLDAALLELRDSVLVDSDRANAHLVLGTMFEATGDFGTAEDAYRTALKIEPQLTGPRRNLAAVLDRRVEEFKQKAAEASQQGDKPATVAAGTRAGEYLAEIERLRREELELLKRDARLVPRNAAIHHQLGLSLYLHGQREEAEAELKKACELAPRDPYFPYYLAIFYRDTKRPREALTWAQKAVELRPDGGAYVQLLQELRRGE